MTEKDLNELCELSKMSEDEIIADFISFCKFAEIPIDSESWNFYMIESRDQA
jgi:hypothetical protein